MSSKPPPPPATFRILYFASAATYTKKSQDDFPAPLQLRDLFPFLDSKYPGFFKSVLCSCTVAVNQEYVDVDVDDDDDVALSKDPPVTKITRLEEGDEVVLIPPVSSG